MSGPELRRLADAVHDLAARVEDLETGADSSADFGDRLAALETGLRGVSGVVERLTAPAARHDLSGWDALTTEQAGRRWREMRRWVDELIARNDISAKELPDCWYQHPGLVDELDALHAAWLEVSGPAVKGVDRIWWRETLARARERWPRHNPSGCASAHAPVRARTLSDGQAWEAFLTRDAATRRPLRGQTMGRP